MIQQIVLFKYMIPNVQSNCPSSILPAATQSSVKQFQNFELQLGL